ncbi:MAG: Fur family transcriptional regulator [Pseudomonadota bacterium]
MQDRVQETKPLATKEVILLHALRTATRPRTAYELIDQLRDEGIKTPPTVYRALNRLISLGLVHRLESLNAYLACQSGQCGPRANPAFAICDGCGDVAEIVGSAVIAGVKTWAQGSNFTVGSITFELHGRCRSCRDGNNDPEHGQ